MRDHFEEHIKAALKKLSRKELGASRKGLVVRPNKPKPSCRCRVGYFGLKGFSSFRFGNKLKSLSVEIQVKFLSMDIAASHASEILFP